ncbi:MAG: methyltransferase domain-containing protein [Eubacteriales bacterium]
MNNNWSQYIQTTEELYQSRSLRFHDGNKDLWLPAIGVTANMNVLEIGCAGGLFCHRIKTYLPNVTITGLDFDIGHIAWAKEKSEELNLDCVFINGDATAMPFTDNSFDLCYSYTVAEHIPTELFLNEQRRVLKKNGRISVMSVRSRLGVKDENWFIRDAEEIRLFEKVWEKAGDYDKEKGIGSYEMTEHDYPKALEKAGFRNVNVEFITVVDYAPDNADVSDKTALLQINTHRLHVIASAEKALRIAPDSLTDDEKQMLLKLINERFDKRVEQYKNGEKLWDFSTSTVLIASGIK